VFCCNCPLTFHFRVTILIEIALAYFYRIVKNSIEFRSYLTQFQRYKYFRFWRPYIATSGCPSLSQSPEFPAIANSKSDVGISILTAEVPDTKYTSGFGCHITISGIDRSINCRFYMLVVIKDPISAVAVSMPSGIRPYIYMYFRFWRPYYPFRLSITVLVV